MASTSQPPRLPASNPSPLPSTVTSFDHDPSAQTGDIQALLNAVQGRLDALLAPPPALQGHLDALQVQLHVLHDQLNDLQAALYNLNTNVVREFVRQQNPVVPVVGNTGRRL
ncbi:hypothetical protein BGX33_000823 [Mortierella sp. NVP41]|nr:hypothetical protein BGX33_000823 [Mortierella sp. NVP41]